MQADEAMRRRVVARAQEIYEGNGCPPVYVSALFNDSVHIRKAEVESLAFALYNIVVRNLPTVDSSGNEKYDWVNRSYFPETFDTVSVHRLTDITQTFFSCPGSTWIGPLTVDEVKRVLAAKEPKYAAYRNKCEEVWLVINADMLSMSTWFEIDEQRLMIPYLTKFDRLFLFLHFSNKVVELMTRR